MLQLKWTKLNAGKFIKKIMLFYNAHEDIKSRYLKSSWTSIFEAAILCSPE
jgi:hypothetical protein